MTIFQIVFIITGLIALAASLMMVVSRKLVHAALWMILALGATAVLLVLLEANFLAVVQVVIYIGAIAILIIFGVMLTRRVMQDTGPQVNRNWWLAAIVAIMLFGSLVAILSQVPNNAATAPPLTADESALLKDLGSSLVDVNRFVLPFEVASILLLAALIGAMVIARPFEAEEKGGQR